MRQFIYRIFNIKENKYTMTGYGWYLDEFPLAMFDEDLLVVGNIHQTLKKTKK